MKKKMIFVVLMMIAILPAILVAAIGQEQPEDVSPTIASHEPEVYGKWFDFQFDPDREDLPTREMAEKIEEGMSVGEAYEIMGKPQRDVGSGEVVLEWKLDTGERLIVSYWNDYDLREYRAMHCAILNTWP